MLSKFSIFTPLVSLFLAFFFAAFSEGDVITAENVQRSAGAIPVQSAPHTVYDYFDAAKIPIVNQRLQAVERYHMNQKVIENIANGKYKFALVDVDFTLRYFPNHPKGLQLLTTLAALTKNQSLPIRYFEKAIALYPSHAITHAQYGRFLVTIGDLENGIQKLSYSVQMDPKLTAGYVWLTEAYEKKGDLQLTREARERAKELGFTGKLSSDPTR